MKERLRLGQQGKTFHKKSLLKKPQKLKSLKNVLVNKKNKL
jgi:hypothetical protein